MKKIFILFSLCVLPSAFVYSQTEAELDCKANLENIFKVFAQKIKYEAIHSIYTKLDIKDSIIRDKNSFFYIDWNSFFESIKEPLYVNSDGIRETEDIRSMTTEGIDNRYWKQFKDSIDRIEHVRVESISEEEMNKYGRMINCMQEEAFKEYLDLIQKIKLEKEIYLKCIDAELAKGDSSKYAKDIIISYNYRPPMSSLLGISITKLDYFKVFKEFILNDNREVLPDYLIMKAYLKCGCKI